MADFLFFPRIFGQRFLGSRVFCKYQIIFPTPGRRFFSERAIGGCRKICGLFAVQFTEKPEFCRLPFAADGAFGDFERFGNFRVAHPAEKTHFDDLRLLLVEFRQPVENIVENQNRIGALLDRNLQVVNREMNRIIAAFSAA